MPRFGAQTDARTWGAAPAIRRYRRAVPSRTPPLTRRTVLSGVVVSAGLLPLAACRGPGFADSFTDLRILVPNAPGGGYDTTARIVAQVLEDEGLTDHVEVFNVEGASGTVGLARTAHETGNADLLMMMGLGVVGALVENQADVRLDQVTPIARLIGEAEIVAVPAGSRFGDLGALLDAWRADPRRIQVGGGSATGGPDHLAAHLLAQAVGIDPRQVRYHQYDGGGPLLAALFSGRLDFAVSGVGEAVGQIRNREIDVLAVTSEADVEGLRARTLRELGVELDFSNWRGLVAPPGLTAEQEEALVALVTDLAGTGAWRAQERANGWSDAFLAGTEFGRFLEHESARVTELLAQLGVR